MTAALDAVALLDKRGRVHLGLVSALSLVVGLLEAAGAGLVLALLNVALAEDGSPVELPIGGDPTTWFGDRSRDSVVLVLCAVFGAFFVLRGLVFLASTYSKQRFVQQTAVQLSRRLIDGYFHLPYPYHVGVNSAEPLRNAYLNVQQMARTAYQPTVDIVTNGTIVVLLVATLVVTSSVVVVFVASGLGVVLVLLLRLVQRRLKAEGRVSQQASHDALQAALEGLRGIRELKQFGVEGHFVERFRDERATMARAAWRKDSLKELPRVLLETFLLLAVLSLLAVTIAAGDDAGTGLAELGLLAYVGARLLPPLQSVAAGLNDLAFTRKALDEVVADLDRIQREAETDDGGVVPLREHLALRDVGVTYEGSQVTALDGVDLELRRGERIGICGRSGEGKTTLLDVLTGLLAPTRGEVVVDGHPVDATRAGWRRNVAVVAQDAFLLDDTVEANVALGQGAGAIDADRVWAALETAQLAEHVRSSPAGLRARVGERGLRLSGGQRQRLAVARALYADRPIVVLDEGTSALDAVTEDAFLDALHDGDRTTTVVLVAHRLQTLRRCDRVVVIEGGRVTADGPFEELERTHPLFLASLGPSSAAAPTEPGR